MTSPFGEAEFLTLRLGGAPGRPERLLLVGRPVNGLVRVREWTSNSWNTEGEDYDVPTGELLDRIEGAYAERVPVSEEMYRVREWLGGSGQEPTR